MKLIKSDTKISLQKHFQLIVQIVVRLRNRIVIEVLLFRTFLQASFYVTFITLNTINLDMYSYNDLSYYKYTYCKYTSNLQIYLYKCIYMCVYVYCIFAYVMFMFIFIYINIIFIYIYDNQGI